MDYEKTKKQNVIFIGEEIANKKDSGHSALKVLSDLTQLEFAEFIIKKDIKSLFLLFIPEDDKECLLVMDPKAQNKFFVIDFEKGLINKEILPELTTRVLKRNTLITEKEFTFKDLKDTKPDILSSIYKNTRNFLENKNIQFDHDNELYEIKSFCNLGLPHYEECNFEYIINIMEKIRNINLKYGLNIKCHGTESTESLASYVNQRPEGYRAVLKARTNILNSSITQRVINHTGNVLAITDSENLFGSVFAPIQKRLEKYPDIKTEVILLTYSGKLECKLNKKEPRMTIDDFVKENNISKIFETQGDLMKFLLSQEKEKTAGNNLGEEYKKSPEVIKHDVNNTMGKKENIMWKK